MDLFGRRLEKAAAKSRRGRTWLVFLTATMLALATHFVISVSRERADAARLALSAFHKVEGLAHREHAYEWQAVAERGVSPELVQAREATRVETRRAVVDARAFDRDDGAEGLAERVRAFQSAIDEQLKLLVARRFEQAERVEEERTHPAFAALDAFLDTEVDEAKKIAEQRARETELGSAAALLLAAMLIALLFARRERSQWRLALVTKQNESILGSAAEGIYGLDGDGHATFVNAAAASMTGHHRDDLLGRSIHELVHHTRPDGSPYPMGDCPISTALRDGVPQRVSDEVYWRKDGTSFPVEYTAAPIREDGDATGAVVVFRDISERRELDKRQAEFTSVVSHELRTPLTSIRGSLGLLAGGALGQLPEKGQRMVEIAVQNTDRLVRLINDILDMERIEAGKISVERRPTGAGELISRAVDEMSGMAAREGVELSASPLDAHVLADPDRILQTLTNLISNAIKFSPPGAPVSVSAERHGAQVIFRVADEGRGIPADKLESIFEPFQQVDASDSREKGGTGLGLAICRSIVDQHGGRIWAESAGGEGSRLYFTLPISDRFENAASHESVAATVLE